MTKTAFYRLEVNVIKRSGREGGRSIVAAAAYRSGDKIKDARYGQTHDYGRKSGVVFSTILTPAHAPDWMKDREALWNGVEAVEIRKDAQLGREVLVSLPRELNREGQIALVRDFAQRSFVDRGMVADISIHETLASDGKPQPHAHILLTLRSIEKDGFGKKERGWNSTDLLRQWRGEWEEQTNGALESSGSGARADCRSLAARGITRAPEPKLGMPHERAQELSGASSAYSAWSDTRQRNSASGGVSALRMDPWEMWAVQDHVGNFRDLWGPEPWQGPIWGEHNMHQALQQEIRPPEQEPEL